MKSLPLTDFVNNAPLEIGEQININHENCSAGVDTKKRLYIKRVHGGILAFCQHCSTSGYYFNDKSRDSEKLRKWIKNPEESSVYKKTTAEEIEDYLINNTFQPNLNTIAWFCKYFPEFNGPLIRTYFCFDKLGNIVFPIKNYYRQITGMQTRTFKTKPKYITEYASNTKTSGSWYTHDCTFNFTLVITEDCLSAFKINYTLNIDTLALLGTTLHHSDEDVISTR